MTRLHGELLASDTTRELTDAGIGRGAARTVDKNVRGDRIRWIEPHSAAQRRLFQQLDGLRQSLNRTLFLGLADHEAHFALYPPGAGYRRHVDRFGSDPRRVLSFVLYLNQDWQAADGGELVLYRGDVELTRVVPRGGTLVLFLSAETPHEVLPARRVRTSIAGWFRQPAGATPGVVSERPTPDTDQPDRRRQE